MPGEQAEVPAAQGGAFEAHRAGVRRDRVLAGRERQAQADGHAQAVPEAAGHTPRPVGEGLRRELLQRVQVHKRTHYFEILKKRMRVFTLFLFRVEKRPDQTKEPDLQL